MKTISFFWFLFPSKRLVNTRPYGLLVLGCIFIFSTISGQTVTLDSTRKQIQLDSIKNANNIKAEDNPRETVVISDNQNTNEPKQTIIGEKFCDVRFEGGDVIFENITFAADIKMISGAHNKTEGNFQKGATVIYLKERHTIFVHCGYFLIHFRIEKDPSTGKWKNPFVSAFEADSKIEKEIISKDGNLAIFQLANNALVYQTNKDRPLSIDGKLFTHSGAIYEDVEKGLYVASTPTMLFVNTKEWVGTYKYSDIAEAEVSPLIRLIIDTKDGKIRIRDSTIANGDVWYEIRIDIDNSSQDNLKSSIVESNEPLSTRK